MGLGYKRGGAVRKKGNRKEHVLGIRGTEVIERS